MLSEARAYGGGVGEKGAGEFSMKNLGREFVLVTPRQHYFFLVLLTYIMIHSSLMVSYLWY